MPTQPMREFLRDVSAEELLEREAQVERGKTLSFAEPVKAAITLGSRSPRAALENDPQDPVPENR